LLYKLAELKFSISLTKLITSFLSQTKFGVSVESEISAKGYISRGATRFCPVPHILQYIYINDMPQTSGVHQGLFADDTCIYATDRKKVIFSESYSEVLVLLKHGVKTET
jgi:hypothetical protein